MLIATQPSDKTESVCLCGSDECVPAPSKTPITDDAVIYLEVGETILGCDTDGYVSSHVSRALELELRSSKDWNTSYDKSLNQLADELFQQDKEIEEQQEKINKLEKDLEEAKDELSDTVYDNIWLNIGILSAALCLAGTGHILLAFLFIIFMLCY